MGIIYYKTNCFTDSRASLSQQLLSFMQQRLFLLWNTYTHSPSYTEISNLKTFSLARYKNQRIFFHKNMHFGWRKLFIAIKYFPNNNHKWILLGWSFGNNRFWLCKENQWQDMDIVWNSWISSTRDHTVQGTVPNQNIFNNHILSEIYWQYWPIIYCFRDTIPQLTGGPWVFWYMKCWRVIPPFMQKILLVFMKKYWQVIFFFFTYLTLWKQ